MFERFTDRARRIVVQAQEEARRLNHNYIGTEHILLGIIDDGEGVAAKVLESLGISRAELKQQVEEIIGRGAEPVAPEGHLPFTPRAKKLLELSLREALQLSHNYIGTEHILLGAIREGEGVAAQILVSNGVDLNRARQQVIQLLSVYQNTSAETQPAAPAPEPTQPATSVREPSPVLDQYDRNLTVAASLGKLDPVVGRAKEIQRIIQVLSRRARNCPVLIGEPGVGATAIVAGLAFAIVNQTVPTPLQSRQLYMLDLGALLAGTDGRADGRAEVESRLNAIFAEAREAEDVILVFDELRATTGYILTAILNQPDLRVIVTATPRDFSEYLAANAAAGRSLQTINVAEPSVDDAVEMLKGVRDKYEAYHRAVILDGALLAAAMMARERITDRALPGSAVALLDEAGARLHTKRMAAPPRLRELDEKIADVRRAKEAEIDAQDFEKAANLRDEEKRLLAEKSRTQKDWEDSRDTLAQLDEEDVVQACADLAPLPLPPTEPEREPQPAETPRHQNRPPATLTPEVVAVLVTTDAEFWGMI
ncbi:MAG TPA: Clp protease N-terminal domain-containing protein [Actinospica sp.]|jgi:ATP-dependent Clp protease ATP-binding subunit ClpC|nr:Clp protease N-terminal domain-containing protein [Actinospica sp.]